jgi:hypothetical protein
METFQIEIKETLSTVINVNANSETEAISKIEALYTNEKIILDYDDHQSTDFDLKGLEKFENNADFSNFVLKNAEQMISSLSIEELAKIGFGSLINAKNNYEK